LQWDDDGAGTYKLNVYHVTASGQQSDLLISSQAGSCTNEEEPGDTLSLEVVCPGAAFVNHNWPAIEPNVVFIAYVNGVEVDRVSATKSDIGLVDYYFDEADLPGSGLYAIRVEIGFGTLDNPTIVSGQTIEGCGEEPEPSVFVRNLSCNGTGVLHWANLPEDTALLITGEIDGAPTRNYTYYPFEPTGSDDFELSLRFDDFSLSIEIGDPGPVISITVRNSETNEVYTTASAPCAAGASAWQLSGVDCDGTATLTWTDLPETMAFSVYPALMPAPAPGTILSGETGTAGPGSGSHTISIDLSEYRFMDFSLVVTAGPVDDEQVQVANDFVMDCGLVWVDPDPDGGETPASGENPGAGSAANQPNGSATPIVTALPDTGVGSAATGAFGWSAMLMLAALALAFAVTGGRLRWSAHQGR